MKCLDENQLVAFVSNALGPAELREVEAELDRCPSCRLLLVDWAKASLHSASGLAAGSDASPAIAPISSVRRGSVLGRYEIVGYLGSGGMGVVFRGNDPKLNRQVAIKLLRSQHRNNRVATTRLLREAQAMAKLKHPNVLTVYDVGQEGELVYLAMELVEAGNLHEWVQRESRDWKTIVQIFADVASGLFAAHQTGIIHRDVKPGNLLVDDRGVVKIADFGLAQNDSTEKKERRSPVGTIGYIAPEVFAGKAATESSDQYSVCISLYEALHSRLPPDAGTAGEREWQWRRGLPSGLRTLIKKGTDVEPSQRFASMHELEVALRKWIAPSLRPFWIAGAMAAAAIAGSLYWSTAPVQKRCPADTETMAGMWNPERSLALEKRFSASKLPYADVSWRVSKTGIEEYSEKWLSMQVENCRDTKVTATQSDSKMDQRSGCLRRRALGLQTLLSHFEKAEAKTIEHAASLVEALPAIAGCSADAVVEWSPARGASAQDLARTKRLETKLAKADALYSLGDYSESATLAQELVGECDDEIDTPLRALAGFRLGQSYLKQLQSELATRALKQAASDAAVIGDSKLAASIWIGLAISDGYYVDKFDTGMAYLNAAKAAVLRRGGDALLRLRIQQIEGLLALVAQNTDDALRLLDGALEGLRELPDPPTQKIIEALSLLSLVYRSAGKLKEAERTLESGLALQREQGGQQHPDVVQILLTLGEIQSQQGDYEKAWQTLEEGREVLESTVGKTSRDYAEILSNQSIVRLMQGAFVDASHLLEASLTIRRVHYPEDIRGLAESLVNMAAVFYNSGQEEQAKALYEESLPLMIDSLRPNHPDVAVVHEGLGLVETELGNYERGEYHYLLAKKMLSGEGNEQRLAHVLGNWALLKAKKGQLPEAKSLYQDALRTTEALLGPNTMHSAYLLAGLGEVYFLLRQQKMAKEYVLRSIAIQEAAGSSPLKLAESQFVLAQVLWAIPGEDRKEALRLAKQAQEVFVQHEKQAGIAEAAQWLSSR